jgi:tetratricopeptide (TPR) repeat protein
MLLVLEDLHWADDATLQLLEHLAPRLAEIPLMLLGTYRDVDLEVSRPLAKTLRQLVRERLIEKIALHRLGEEGVAAMLEGLAGRPAPESLAKLIHDETEGNPFFVEEVFLHLEEENRLFDARGEWREKLSAEDLEVPEGVRLVVGRRLENLSEEESAALTAAAVAGRRFSFEVLEKVSALDADALLDAVEHAERLKLIEPVATANRRETGYRFGHELIRQTLLSALSMPRRQRLHLRIAEALEASAADPTLQASTLAHHLYQAGAAVDEEKTIHYLTLAGDQALDTGAFEDAQRSFDDALSLLEGGAPTVGAHLLRSRGLARQSLGRWEEALADWEKAVPLYEQTADHETLAELGVAGAYLHFWQAFPADGVTLASRVLESVPEEQAGDRIRLRGILGACQSMTRSVEVGAENTALAVAEAEKLGDPKILGEALRWRCWHLWFSMGRRELVASAARAADLLRETGDSWGFVDAAGQYQLAASHMGDLAGTMRFGSEAEALAERLGNFGSLLHFKMARIARGWIAHADVAAAEELHGEVIALLEQAGTAWRTSLLTWLGEYWFRAGDWEKARDHMAPLSDDVRGTAWEGTIPAFGMRLECYLGNEGRAREALARILAQAPDLDPPTTVGAYEVLFARIEGLNELGAFDEVGELYPMAVAALDTGTVISHFGHRSLETIAGIAASAAGQWHLAERHFQTALQQAEQIPFATEKADVRRFHAQMLKRRDDPGDRARAKTLLEEAIAVYTELSEPRHRELCESQLSRL